MGVLRFLSLCDWLRLHSPLFIPSKEEVKMEDLSPPDYNGPSSYGRAPRQSR
jgi:hypothetical protein